MSQSAPLTRRSVFTVGSFAVGALITAGCSDAQKAAASTPTAPTAPTTPSAQGPVPLAEFLTGTWTGWVSSRRIHMTIEITPGKWRSTTALNQAEQSSDYGMLPGHTVHGEWKVEKTGDVQVSSSDPNMQEDPGFYVTLSGLPQHVTTPAAATPSSAASDDNESYNFDFAVSWDGTVLSAVLEGAQCLQMRRLAAGHSGG